MSEVWVTRPAESIMSFAHEYIHLWTHMPTRTKGVYFTPIGKMITIETSAFQRVFGYLPECDTCEQKTISLEVGK